MSQLSKKDILQLFEKLNTELQKIKTKADIYLLFK